MTVSWPTALLWRWSCLFLLSAACFLLPSGAFAATSTAALDTDGDGLTDVIERRIGSDPTLRDTDGDGYEDKTELFNAWSPTSSAAIPLKKSIAIHLKAQTLDMQVAGIPIRSFRISSGKATMPTPVGMFAIRNKIPKAWSRSAGLWMPYWMAFDYRGRGLHELPIWPGGKREGANHLGIPVSHGCVRLGIGPAKELYDWSPIGTPVIIQR